MFFSEHVRDTSGTCVIVGIAARVSEVTVGVWVIVTQFNVSLRGLIVNGSICSRIATTIVSI